MPLELKMIWEMKNEAVSNATAKTNQRLHRNFVLVFNSIAKKCIKFCMIYKSSTNALFFVLDAHKALHLRNFELNCFRKYWKYQNYLLTSVKQWNVLHILISLHPIAPQRLLLYSRLLQIESQFLSFDTIEVGGKGGGVLKHLSSIENVSPLSRTYRCKDTFYLYWMSSTSIESTILLRWQCKLSVEYTFSLPAGSLFFSFFCWTLFASGFLLLASHC